GRRRPGLRSAGGVPAEESVTAAAPTRDVPLSAAPGSGMISRNAVMIFLHVPGRTRGQRRRAGARRSTSDVFDSPADRLSAGGFAERAARQSAADARALPELVGAERRAVRARPASHSAARVRAGIVVSVRSSLVGVPGRLGFLRAARAF